MAVGTFPRGMIGVFAATKAVATLADKYLKITSGDKDIYIYSARQELCRI
jgi:hypothetical protein